MGSELQTTPRRPRSALHDYQERAARFLIEHTEAGLFLDPGLGKTASTLTAIADLKALGEVRRVLVVGPPRVVATVWTREADLWEHTAHLKVLALTGTAEQRRRLLVEQLAETDVVCISYGLLPWLHRTVRRETWDWVVIEESSLVKNATTKRWKGVAYTALTAKRRTILTGTPTPRSLADLWAQVTLADLGRRFGRSQRAFLSRYFIQTDYGWEMKPGTRQALTTKLKDFAIALRAKDYLDLPALIETNVSVEMPGSAWEVYTELARSFQVELEDGSTVDVANAGVMAGKLAQCSQGALFLDDSGTWTELHTAKMDAVEDLVSELQGEPVLIAYWYRHDLARLQARFPQAPVLGSGMSATKLNALVDAWNRGEIPILLLHPACLHGDTEVLTETRGWVRLVDVLPHERVFDGVDFVAHDGCSYSGYKRVIDVFGIKMTPDHELLISGKWEKASHARNRKGARREARYKYTGDDPAIGQMFELRGNLQNSGAELQKAQQAEPPALRTLHRGDVSPDDWSPHLPDLEANARKMRKPACQGLQALRRARDIGLRALAEVRELLRGYERWVFRRYDDRAYRRERELLERELPLGVEYGTASQQAKQSNIDLQGRVYAPSGAMPQNRCQQNEDAGSTCQGYDTRGGSRKRAGVDLREREVGAEVWERAHVYDLVNCGPRNRFLIRNAEGEVFVSHNSAGHGLNLQAGGRHLIWLALPWSWELVQQTTARLYRQGQTKPVMVYRILCADTIDERIVDVLNQRQEGHDTLIAALKAEVRQTVSRADRLKDARAAMQRAHPDRGGSTAAFIAARQAYERIKAEEQAA